MHLQWKTQRTSTVVCCIKLAYATCMPLDSCTCIYSTSIFFIQCCTCRLYLEQLKSAEWACVKLGSGIALFQALSNIAINGMVCVSSIIEFIVHC